MILRLTGLVVACLLVAATVGSGMLMMLTGDRAAGVAIGLLGAAAATTTVLVSLTADTA